MKYGIPESTPLECEKCHNRCFPFTRDPIDTQSPALLRKYRIWWKCEKCDKTFTTEGSFKAVEESELIGLQTSTYIHITRFPIPTEENEKGFFPEPV